MSPARLRNATALHGLLLSLWALGVLTATLVAVRQPLHGNDYTCIWGLKGRALLRTGELASVLRVDPAGSFAHPEYPPLWPIVLASVARLEGRWDDLLLSPLWPVLCLSASLLAYRAARGPQAARLAAGAAVALLPYWRVSIYPGYAEGLLVVFVLAALGEVDRLSKPAALLRFTGFLVLACLTKNEGAVIVAAAALALGAGALRSEDPVARRNLLRAAVVGGGAPFLLAVLPWQLWLASRLPAGITTDFTGGVFSLDRALSVLRVAGALALEKGWVIVPCVACLLVLAPAVARRRSGVLLAVALHVGALLGAFVYSSRDLIWHVLTTWDRLLVVPGAVVAVVLSEAASGALASPDPPASDELGEPLARG